MVEQKAKTTVKKTTVAAKKTATAKAVVDKTKKTAAVTAEKKVVAKTTAKTEPKKAAAPAVKKAPAAAKKVAKPTPEERYRMVETAAYFIAERSGFQGCTTEHWAAAELEIAAKLGE